MADQENQHQDKTEEPSQRRLEEAQRKGQVASSRELNTWFILLAATGWFIFAAPGFIKDLTIFLSGFLDLRHWSWDGWTVSTLTNNLWQWSGYLIKLVIAPFILLIFIIVLGQLIQHGWVLSKDPLTPKLSKISPSQGMKRIFGAQGWVEFLKGLIKIGLISAILVVVFLPEFKNPSYLLEASLRDDMTILYGLVRKLLAALVIMVAFLAALDFFYQKRRVYQKLRMTRQELKEEIKETEGDPYIKARIRSIRIQRSKKRMMQAVPKADVIITNPTHYAVALAYQPDKDQAPRVIAKGADILAAKIREIAENNHIPIIANPPLARTLYTVELDQEIPLEHYRAVAEIISYVWRLKGKLR